MDLPCGKMLLPSLLIYVLDHDCLGLSIFQCLTFFFRLRTLTSYVFVSWAGVRFLSSHLVSFFHLINFLKKKEEEEEARIQE